MNFEAHNQTEHQAQQTSNEQNQQAKNNPVLEFILNVTDAGKYIWQHYMEWIIDVSWGKLFLACLLTLIIGGILSIHTLANWLVIGSLLLKCFIGKEDQVQATSPQTQPVNDVSEKVKPDEVHQEN
ncbi:hypothetical protein [Undibacterium danionis]|uniref:Uncharacterized protein n=1 Tax=Undibacterium danionis TaxID=1812100 RepID=A0ABV6IGI4_9BURK